MLTHLTLAATLVIGLCRGPWWVWVVAGGAIAFLSITDPRYLRPALSEARLGEALGVLRTDLVCLASGCTAAAMAFAVGRLMSWALPL